MFISVITSFPSCSSNKLLKMRWTWVHKDPAPRDRGWDTWGIPSCSSLDVKKGNLQKLQWGRADRREKKKVKQSPQVCSQEKIRETQKSLKSGRGTQKLKIYKYSDNRGEFFSTSEEWDKQVSLSSVFIQITSKV